jgi:tetratricopeptide (TPR) repeat protein
MITKKDITAIFSAAYTRASLREDCDMRLVADLFETVRVQLNTSEPLETWEFIVLDNNKLKNDLTVELLSELKEYYYIFLFEKVLAYLNEIYSSDREKGLLLWEKSCAEAAVYFREDLICMLCIQKAKWGEKNEALANISRLPKLMRESRWPDAFPFYEEIASNKRLSDEIRCYAELALFQIIIYEYLEYSRALKHLKNAENLLPRHYAVRRGWGEYYLKEGETQKARDQFLQVIATKPGDYISFNLIGDSYLAENSLENAESWYMDALHKNMLQNDSHRRLINLYGIKTWFADKEPQLEGLLEEIKKRPRFINSDQLIAKGLASSECFADLQLYQAYRSVGAAWFSADRPEKAEEWYNKAHSLFSETTTALIDLAYLKMQLQQPDKARELLTDALEIEKDNFDVHWALAYYYQLQKQKEDSLNTFMKCLLIRPAWEDMIYNYIGNLYYSFKDYNDAIVYYRKAIAINDNYPVFTDNLAGAYQGQAELLFGNQDYAGTEDFYILAANTNDNSGGRWNILGNFYFGQQRWQEAAESYLKAIAIVKDPVFIENCGLAYERIGRFEDAEKYYLMALEYDLNSGKVFNRLGVFYYERRDYEKSIANYLKALERQPDEPLYLENLAMAYGITSNLDAAIANYEKVLKLLPDNARVLNATGVVYYNQKQYEPAIEYYRKALEIEGNNVTFIKNLGLAFRMTSRIDESIEIYKRALNLNSKDFLIWNELGILYYEKNDNEIAINYYKKAIMLQPNDPILYSNLALALNAQGKTAEALNVTSGYPVSDEVKQKVNELLKEYLPWLFESAESTIEYNPGKE